MTDHSLRQLYNAAAKAAHVGNDRQLDQALDLIIMGCSSEQAGLVEWAMDNGYPEFETVRRYGVIEP